MLNFDKYFSEYKDHLARLISIPSVYEESDKYPFGEPIQKALEEMIEIAKELGFRTYLDRDGYYGYAELGEGEMFGVLGHLDVVPVGDLSKWNFDPFTLTEKEEKLFGRGTQDDKGPTLASMYALKILLDQGFSLNKRIRFIFGTDEETLWRGINKYEKEQEMPTMGFSPDSTFPLIYAEKGLLQIKLISRQKSDLIWSGGDAFNSVPDSVHYNDDKLEEFKDNLEKLNYEYLENSSGIEVIGKAMHAQVANLGVNAIVHAFEAIDSLYSNDIIKFVVNEIGNDAHAYKVFGDVSDEHSGKLMFNIGKFSFQEEFQELCIDIRIPVTVEKSFVMEKLSSIAKKYALELLEYDWLRSIYVEKDSLLIKSLMEAYQEVTNDFESEPKTSGGATYARAMDNCVAFGSVQPSSPKTEHQANEYILIDDIKLAMNIYMQAFKKLL